MKKFLALVILGFIYQVGVWAQPTIAFEDATPCTGDEFCMEVSVRDFTDILSTQYTIEFDTDLLEFVNVQSFGLDLLTAGNFDLTDVANGNIGVDWERDVCAPGATGATLADDSVIYELCFRVVGTYGEASSVGISNTSTPVVTRVNACPNNIGLIRDNALVSACVRPLTLYASDEVLNPGDLACVDFRFTGFDDLTSAQFSIEWDDSVLEFENVDPSQGVPNLSLGSFGLPGGNIPNNKMTVSWAFVDLNDPGVTLADSSLFFTVCFRVVGECEESSQISFSSNPTPIEVTNTIEEGFNITLIQEPGSVTVTDCDPEGLQLFADCGPTVNINDEVCVEVTTAGFANISDLEFLMEWNSSILSYKEVRNVNGSLTNFLSSLNESNIGNGILGVEWEASNALPSVNIPDGTVLFEVCFDVVGLGSNSPFTFDQQTAVVRQNNGPNIGIFPANCEVVVNQPAGLAIEVADAEVPLGDTVCVDVTVGNFNDIVDLQFSLAWDDSQLEFLELTGLALPEPGAATINQVGNGPSSGGLTFEWTPAAAHTLPDGTVVFQLCFIGIGTPETCHEVTFEDLPIETEVITAESNGDDIGLVGQAGEICILNPEGFYLDFIDTEGIFEDTVCISARVSNFEDITEFDFGITWDPTALNFIEVQESGNLPGISFNGFVNTNVGLLEPSWQDLNGATLPDSTAVFDVCFELIGQARECYGIGLNDFPTPNVMTLTGDGSIFSDTGSVCILPKIIILDTIITPESCPGAQDGSIELFVTTGGGSTELVFFNWETAPLQFGSRATNLEAGEVEVLIFGEEGADLSLRTTFTIPTSENAPEAIIQEDQITFPCDLEQLVLQGEGSSGDDYSFRWRTLGGDLMPPINEQAVIVEGPGLYIYEVREDASGCFDRDSVTVVPPILPLADAGPDSLQITCLQDTVSLGGPLTTPADVNYQWTTEDGQIIPGEENIATPRTATEGTYIFTVSFQSDGCSATDTIVVVDTRELPFADPGMDMEIGCADGSSVTLDGSQSFGPNDINFEWRDANGSLIGAGQTQEVTEVGTYFLTVIDQVSSCSATDSVVVNPSIDFPTVMITGDTLTINCLVDTVDITGSVTSNQEFSFEWITQNGGTLVEGTETSLMPQAATVGTYVLVGTNTDNGCSATDTLIVVEDRVAPMAEAGDADLITCTETCVDLDGSASSQGDNISYSWTFEGIEVSTEINPEVCNAGVYTLIVTNNDNGCTAVDSLEVMQDEDVPVISFIEIGEVTCNDNTAQITAIVSPANGNYNLVWTAQGTGMIDSGQGTLTISVTGADTYQLTATDVNTGCPAVGDAVVVANTDAPETVAEKDGDITCADDTVILSAVTGNNPANTEYVWTADNGTDPEDGVSTTVTAPGIYTLTTTNPDNGCTASTTIEVLDLQDNPVITIQEVAPITCTQTSALIDASASDPRGIDFTVVWTPLDGGEAEPSNALVTEVSQAGRYELVITNNATGCTSQDTVTVTSEEDFPLADAGETVSLECNATMATLDGSGSDSGSDFSYAWMFNGEVVSTEQNPMVDGIGVYTLTVVNNVTGCSATDEVEVTQSNPLEVPFAGADQFLCEDSTMLEANLPANTIGQWASLSGGVVIETDNEFSSVVGLTAGANLFAWTLSTAACPNYGTDTVTIFVESAPVVSNDLFTLDIGETDRTLSVIGNDNLSGVSSWTLTIGSQPSLGATTINTNGTINYTVPANAFGTDEFTYTICNDNCPDLCDSTSVQIIIPQDPNQPDPETPNAITPNGDGMNDTFVFEQLELTNDFPDNELIIFNRWGDIVFEARPYNNDWNGTSDGGQELPAGTYYYILRLDISNGEIIRGDVTIVK